MLCLDESFVVVDDSFCTTRQKRLVVLIYAYKYLSTVVFELVYRP